MRHIYAVKYWNEDLQAYANIGYAESMTQYQPGDVIQNMLIEFEL